MKALEPDRSRSAPRFHSSDNSVAKIDIVRVTIAIGDDALALRDDASIYHRSMFAY